MAVTQSLSVTEVSGSVSYPDNSSQVKIVWKSTQSGESWNGYTRTARYYISINGGAETEYTVEYTLPQNSTVTLVSKTITVKHKSDAKLRLPILGELTGVNNESVHYRTRKHCDGSRLRS